MIVKSWKAILAMADSNRVIGKDGTLPWRLPEDLAFFKRTTKGNTIVMGRRTMEEIKQPLPHRHNVVLTRQNLTTPGFTFINNIEQLDALPSEGETFIIGGAQLYALTLPLCAELFVTHVKGDFDGDTFMPPFEHLFDPVETLEETDSMRIVRYRNKVLN